MSPVLDLLAKFSLACGLCVSIFMVPAAACNLLEKQANAPLAKKLDTPWRYTNMGWQDSTHWRARVKFPKPAAANVHPFVWTALITLASVGLLIWSSNEGDSLAKSTPKNSSIKRRMGMHCDCKPRCKNFCLQDLL